MPVKLRFYRNLRYDPNPYLNKTVLLIKNLPQELRKSDLFAFIKEFATPLFIEYPRDQYFFLI